MTKQTIGRNQGKSVRISDAQHKALKDHVSANGVKIEWYMGRIMDYWQANRDAIDQFTKHQREQAARLQAIERLEK